MDATTLNTQYDTEIDGHPFDLLVRVAIGAVLVAGIRFTNLIQEC